MQNNCWNARRSSPPCLRTTTSAIGAIRAIQESGLRIPNDVSVVGFDDIPWAAYHTPSLTTVRQPLDRMGQMAAQTLIRMIEHGGRGLQRSQSNPRWWYASRLGQAPR